LAESDGVVVVVLFLSIPQVALWEKTKFVADGGGGARSLCFLFLFLFFSFLIVLIFIVF
jgi:hypothetical protein